MKHEYICRIFTLQNTQITIEANETTKHSREYNCTMCKLKQEQAAANSILDGWITHE
jgi:hypothetical protein